jgi:hypothetical protein
VQYKLGPPGLPGRDGLPGGNGYPGPKVTIKLIFIFPYKNSNVSNV